MAATLVELLRERASAAPDAVAYGFLADGEQDMRTLTYGELEERAAATAAMLSRRVAPGARVVLVFEPGLDFLAGFFGCLMAGVVAVPVYPPSPSNLAAGLANLDRVVKDCAADVVLASSLTAALAGEPGAPNLPWLVAGPAGDRVACPKVRPSTVAVIQYTSGSTSTPKGVVLRHRNLLSNLDAMDWFVDRPETGVVASWLPMYHDMGLIGTVLYPMYRGWPGYLMSPLHFLQRPVRWLELISRVRATITGGPSFAYQLCVRRADAIAPGRLDLSSWEVAFNGAEPINPRVLRAFEEAFAEHGLRQGTVVGCYGMAEASLLVTGARRNEPRFLLLDRDRLAEGKAVAPAPEAEQVELVDCGGLPPRHDVRIVDPDTTEEAVEGTVGEIWFRGPSLSDGYWGWPQDGDSPFGATLAETGEGGYLRTGDLGLMRDGRLYVTGRRKELVIVRGRNIYPHDVELTVQQVDPRLRPSGGVVFPTADVDGEGIGVLQEVRGRDEADLLDLVDRIRAAVLAEHQVSVTELYLVAPRSVRKTSSGKIRRGATRDALRAGELTVYKSDPEVPDARD